MITTTNDIIKVQRLRTNMPGYVLGYLTPFASDDEVLEIANLKDRLAELHNTALSRKVFGDRQDLPTSACCDANITETGFCVECLEHA